MFKIDETERQKTKLAEEIMSVMKKNSISQSDAAKASHICKNIFRAIRSLELRNVSLEKLDRILGALNGLKK